MSKRLQLAFVAVIGLIAARAYYQWLFHSGTHKVALHAFGLAGYWSLLAAPAVAIFVPLCLVALRRRVFAASWVIAGAILFAIVIAYLGLFGDFLLCAFITRGVCE